MLHQFSIVVGILLATVVGYVLVKELDHGWRYVQFAFPVLVCVTQVLFAAYVPESPRWLVRQGRVDAAAATLQSLRNGADVSDELETMQRELDEESALDASAVTWANVFEVSRPICR
jgi:MFS family permease